MYDDKRSNEGLGNNTPGKDMFEPGFLCIFHPKQPKKIERVIIMALRIPVGR